jgi:hypothetical protein
MSTTKAASQKAKTSNGNKLKSAIKSKGHPLQYKGSYMKEETANKELLRSFYGTTFYPENIFEFFIGQMIYAISENGFLGLIEVIDEKHVQKLAALQGNGYTFAPLAKVGEWLHQNESKKPAPESGPTEWAPKEREVIARLEAYDIFPVDEFATERELEIFRKILADAEKECSEYYGIVTNSEATEEEKTEAYNYAMELPTAEQLIEQAKGYKDSALNLLSGLVNQNGSKIKDAVFDLLIDEQTTAYNMAYDYGLLIEDLRNFLFSNPDFLKKFVDESVTPAKDVCKCLNKLKFFFDEFEDQQTEIEYLQHALSNYSHCFNASSLISIEKRFGR